MKFNTSKFELQRYKKKKQEIKTATTCKSHYDVNFDCSKEQVRNLSLMISNTATCTFHIRNTVKKPPAETRWDGC